ACDRNMSPTVESARCADRQHPGLMNPEGILPQSPGLRATSYPGKSFALRYQPRRGCGLGKGAVTQPFQGCPVLTHLTQGSSWTRNPGLNDGIPLGFPEFLAGVARECEAFRPWAGR